MKRIPDDQARTLREQHNSQEHGLNKSVKSLTPARNVTRVISFTGGKGGVGKTHTVTNVAIALARQGKSVLLLDADLGLANVDVLLGLRPKYTLQDLFEGTRTLEEIVLAGPEGVSIIPSASGIESICNLSAEQRMMLLEAVEQIAHRYDYLLIDTQAGIGSEVMYFNSASAEIVCVVTPDPTSLTDAYALIKVLSTNYGEKEISVIVNNVSPGKSGNLARAAAETFERLSKAVERFLHVELKYLGSVPADPSAIDAVREQRALVELYPSSPAALALSGVARAIDAEFLRQRVKGGMQFFFKQLLELEAYGS